MFEILKGLDYTPFLVSLKLASLTTFALFTICVPLAFFMARKNFRGKKRDRIDHLASARAAALGARVLPARFSIAVFGAGGVFRQTLRASARI